MTGAGAEDVVCCGRLVVVDEAVGVVAAEGALVGVLLCGVVPLIPLDVPIFCGAGRAFTPTSKTAATERTNRRKYIF